MPHPLHTARAAILGVALLPPVLAGAAQAAGIEHALGLVATWQHASDRRVQDEALASFDLEAAMPLGPGSLNLHLEGNTTQAADGVSLQLGEANADAGTALDASERGRLQLSELSYGLAAGGGELTLGLVDVSGPLDASSVANDEGSQFLGAGLVHNATIEFPDYTVGLYYQLPLDEGGSGLTLVVASPRGIADSDDASYSSVFDLENVGSGVFAAVEWQIAAAQGVTRLGLWGHTADHPWLDGSADDGRNYGVYLSADRRLGEAELNLRLGLANPEVSPAAGFAGLAAALPLRGPYTLGAGLAWTGVSGELAGDVDHSLQGELYLRWQLSRRLALTPALQYLRNSGFDASGSSHDASLWLAGLRLVYSL